MSRDDDDDAQGGYVWPPPCGTEPTEIPYSTRTHEVFEKIVHAMHARYPSRIWTIDGAPVLYEDGEVKPIDRALLDRMALAACTFVSLDSEGGADHHDPVKRYVNAALTLPGFAPKVHGFRTCPWVGDDGVVHTIPGYHDGWLLQWEGPLADPDAVTDEDVDDVLRRLTDFEFAHPEGRTNAVCLFVRAVLDLMGHPQPLTLLRARSPDAGKSLICQILAEVVTGAPPDYTPMPSSESEVQYSVPGTFEGGPPIVAYDNIPVHSTIGGALLHTLLTAPGGVKTRKVRSAGHARIDPTRTIVVASVVGGELDREMTRRTITIELQRRDSARPFLTPDLDRGWALRNRTHIVSCLLRMVRAWHLAGRPKPRANLSSFVGWAERVGGIVSNWLPESRDLFLSGDSRPLPALEVELDRLFATRWTRSDDGRHLPLSSAAVLAALGDDFPTLQEAIGFGSDSSRRCRLGRQLAQQAKRDRFDPIAERWTLRSRSRSGSNHYTPAISGAATRGNGDDMLPIGRGGRASAGGSPPIGSGRSLVYPSTVGIGVALVNDPHGSATPIGVPILDTPNEPEPPDGGVAVGFVVGFGAPEKVVRPPAPLGSLGSLGSPVHGDSEGQIRPADPVSPPAPGSPSPPQPHQPHQPHGAEEGSTKKRVGYGDTTPQQPHGAPYEGGEGWCLLPELDDDPARDQIAAMAARGLAVDTALLSDLLVTARRGLQASDDPTDAARLLQLDVYGPQILGGARGGRIRCRWGRLKTGRLQARDPLLYSVTKSHGLRAAFRAPVGRKIVGGDWRGSHLILAAALSGDTALGEQLCTGDLYADGASIWALEHHADPALARARTKRAILSAINGAGGETLARHLGGGVSAQEAERRRDVWLSRYPALASWLAELVRDRGAHTPVGSIFLGRREPDYKAPSWVLQFVESQALRAVLRELEDAPRLDVVLPVHDEVLLEVEDQHATAAALVLADSMHRSLLAAVEWSPSDAPRERVVEVSARDSWAKQ